jgi:putative SOS response-associated peptidase YedK
MRFMKAREDATNAADWRPRAARLRSSVMCGRYTLKTPEDEIVDEFGLEEAPKVEPHYNVAPTQEVPIISMKHPKKLTFVRWGMIPFWADDPSAGNRFVNVRAETLQEKGSFRRPFEKRRCFVIADGFYEWKHTAVAGKKKTIATPMYVRVPSEKVFAFAGLYDGWKSPDGTVVRSCTILTVPPAPALEAIHDRMPVILPRERRDAWLEDRSPAELFRLLVPFEGKLEVFEVSKLVNKPENDGPECIAPAT